MLELFMHSLCEINVTKRLNVFLLEVHGQLCNDIILGTMKLSQEIERNCFLFFLTNLSNDKLYDYQINLPDIFTHHRKTCIGLTFHFPLSVKMIRKIILMYNKQKSTIL